MIYSTVRLVFGLVLFVACVCFIKFRLNSNKTKHYIITFISVCIITALINLFPIENIFLTFSTPEAAFNNVGIVKLIIDGERSNLIVSEKGDIDNYIIIPQSDEGWKIGIGLKTKKIIQKNLSDIIICVYQYGNSSDYYVTILNINGGRAVITDNRQSNFSETHKVNKTLNKTFYTYYAYVNNIDVNYSININDIDIALYDYST